MITLIGARCKHGNMLSRGVLINPFPLGNLESTIVLSKLFSFFTVCIPPRRDKFFEYLVLVV